MYRSLVIEFNDFEQDWETLWTLVARDSSGGYLGIDHSIIDPTSPNCGHGRVMQILNGYCQHEQLRLVASVMDVRNINTETTEITRFVFYLEADV